MIRILQKLIILLFSVFILVNIFFSCSIKEKQADEDLIILNFEVDEFKQQGKLSDLFEAVKLVYLETKQESLINTIDKIKILKQSILVLDKNSQRILQFDSKGKFLRQIGKHGDGPGEYLEISDFEVDTISDLIYIPDIFKVHIYSLDGAFIKTVKTNFYGSNISKINDDEFAFSGSGRDNRLIITNKDFKIANEYFPYSKLHRLKNQNIFSNYLGKSVFHLSNYDTIYTIDDRKTKPLFYLNFNGKNYNPEDFNKLSKKEKDKFTYSQLNNSKYVRCLNFFPTSKEAFISVNFLGDAFTGLYNFKTHIYLIINRSKIENDITGSFMYFTPKAIWKNNYVFSVPIYKLNKKLNIHVDNSEIEKTRDENSNPVLLFLRPRSM
jgi:hypothetical protein